MEKMSKEALVPLMMLVLWLMVVPPKVVACPSDGGACQDCIVDQLNCGCPSCRPVLRCMGQCLWGGSSRAKCMRRCDCNSGKPKLSDCKKCMSKCKCSCMA
ncbi:hypothetical protein BT93_L2262 [Corymbia citriodora subsp. variegata]|uniref:Uncharacterized protein n=1 Tax=Corymbia citriodora subsp. variegata TaxID=360336 RepID=A0A8T0CKE7_CORYI|nr:hypothetical protein BT93_L2262 [Corymbia citriodora subsp. variegata]